MKLEDFRKHIEKGFDNPILIHQNTNTGNVYVLLVNRKHLFPMIEVKRYVFDGEQWSAGFLYAGKDYVEAMQKFQGCLNGFIADPLEGLKFTCPECKGHRLECCQDGYHVSAVTCINEEGDHDYGQLQSDGEVIRWQCVSCGYVIEDISEITDNVEIAEWVKENCKDD